jgi:spectinomycin phosphotransferase
VKDLPSGLDLSVLLPALAQGWGIAASSVQYIAVGHGSYHWIAVGEDHQRFFATVDDLDHKAWLGDTRDATFVGLGRAFDTAAALRDQGGLDFVHAPLPTIGGGTVRRIGRRHSIAVFPFIDGAAGEFGENTSTEHRVELLRLLVDLHQATPVTLHVTEPRELEFTGRDGLEAALNDLDRPWHSGPFAEPARALLAGHARDLVRRLDDFDQLVGAVTAAGSELVVTHGEPHPGNVMRSHDRLVLIDWDTVGLAPPERDLWLVADAASAEMAMYVDATGHHVNRAAMSLYRRAWELTDVAVYLDLFRSPHQRTEDTEDAWRNLEATIRAEQH